MKIGFGFGVFFMLISCSCQLRRFNTSDFLYFGFNKVFVTEMSKVSHFISVGIEVGGCWCKPQDLNVEQSSLGWVETAKKQQNLQSSSPSRRSLE